nr:hypothetical protein [Tanacetum cinerariifolium]
MGNNSEKNAAARKLAASMVRENDGKIVGKDGKTLRMDIHYPNYVNPKSGQSLNGKPKTGIANPRSGGSILNGENVNPNLNNVSRKVDTTQPVISTSVLEGMETGNTSTLTGENNTRVSAPNNIGDSLASPSFENPSDVNLIDQLGNETQTMDNIWGTTKVNENHEGPNTKSFMNVVTGTKPNSKINFRTLFNEERVENSDFVLPMANVMAAKNKFANSLVGFFIGKRVALPLVKNYLTNTWGKFGFQSVIKDDDDVYYFKFSTTRGLEQVMEQGPWLIRNQPLILTQWTPNLNLEKNKVKKVPVWVKIHKVPVVAYSEDGLMEVDRNLKEEVIMAVPRLEGEGHTIETIKVEYEWKPPRCSDCLVFGHNNSECPKRVVEIPKETIEASDEFTLLQNRRKKGKNVANGVRKVNEALQDENITHHTNASDASTSDVQAENGATYVDDDSEVEDLGNEYEDINSFGLQYTWNQKPKGKGGTLKKLDRVMGNLEFIDAFPGTYVMFQPYRIFDHSPAVLKFPLPVNSKPRPFKFFNLLAYKSSFLVTVSNMWSSQVHGCYMYQVVQKMKMLKKPLRKLLHSHCNLHDRVNKLRVELDAVQKALDQDPHNSTLREEEAVYLAA